MLAKLQGHGVGEESSTKHETGVLVTEEGNVHKEDRQLLFAVLLVLGLTHLHCHVSAGGLVLESECGISGEEKLAEAKWVNVGANDLASHGVVVLDRKCTTLPPDKKIILEYF